VPVLNKFATKDNLDPNDPPSILTIGQISPNLIDAIYAPLLTHIAERQSEQYADLMIEYEEKKMMLMSEAEEAEEEGGDNEVDGDEKEDGEDSDLSNILETESKIEIDMDPPPSINSLLFAQSFHRDELTSQILTPTSEYFTTATTSSSSSRRYNNNITPNLPQWKIHANAAKFERHLDEKYGRLRPFLTEHPEIERFIRSTQRKLARGEIGPKSAFRQGDPPMDLKASIILLFLLHRNGVRWEVMTLSFLFLLVGLQPWALVALVCFGRWMMNRRRDQMGNGWLVGSREEVKVCEPYYARAVSGGGNGGKEAVEKAKHNLLLKPVGEPLVPNGTDADYFTTTTTTTDKPNDDDYFTTTTGKPKDTTSSNDDDDEDEKYDTMLIGSGPATLYTAALLSRTGRTVLVLSPEHDASGAHTLLSPQHPPAVSDTVHMVPQQTTTTSDDTTQAKHDLERFQNVPFDTGIHNIAHTDRQQRFLAPALCTKTDAQGGIRFARIGTQADGYTSDILSVPGMGGTTNTGTSDEETNANDCVPFPLRAGGIATLAEDAAMFLGDGWPTDESTEGKPAQIGNSLSAAYLTACMGINAGSSQYYLSKTVPTTTTNTSTNATTAKIDRLARGPVTSYQESSIRYSSAFADKILPLNPHLRSLVAAMGMRGENLPPSRTSLGAHITNVCQVVGGSAGGDGYTYPVGGLRALGMALGGIVEQNGGKVVTGVRVKELLFREDDSEIEKDEKDDKKKEETKEENPKDIAKRIKPRCYGVKLADDRIISVGTHEDSAVIHMDGFLQTFIFHMPPEIRSKYGIVPGLPALTERRPLLHFLIGLDGDSTELSLTGADWYRLPGASLARDEMDPVTGEVKLGTVGAELVDDWEDGDNADNEDAAAAATTTTNESDDTTTTTTDNTGGAGKRSKRAKKTRRVRYVSGSSWIRVSFPSAKDPSFPTRHPGISTCVVTIEADDDFVRMFDTSPKIFTTNTNVPTGELERLYERVITKDLVVNYPQLVGKICCYKMIGPVRAGLSHTPQRYAASGIRPATEFPGLYVGGSDLTVGDSFSAGIVGGWMAANSVMKYGFIDHMLLKKNITSDLAQYLESPKGSGDGEEEDVAVPFEQVQLAPVVEEKIEDAPQEVKEEGEELAAESTKEE